MLPRNHPDRIRIAFDDRAIASYLALAMDRRSAYRTLASLECRRVGI